MLDEDIVIDFGSHGNSVNHVRAGWSTPETELTWMVGFDSQLLIPRAILWERVFLTLEVMPHVREEKLLSQRLVLAANSMIIGTFEIRDRGTIEVEIPREAVARNAGLFLRFLHPDAATPRALAQLEDDRLLAIAVLRLVLSHMRQPPEERFGSLVMDTGLDGFQKPPVIMAI